MSGRVWTIGYAEATLPGLIGTLKGEGVDTLADLRAVAASRRAGFSKTLLRNSVEAEGIAYRHFRALGTPKPGREAARKGRIAEMRAIYAGQLATPEAQDDLARLRALVAERRVALLCWCADAAKCHRRVVAERLLEADPALLCVDLAAPPRG